MGLISGFQNGKTMDFGTPQTSRLPTRPCHKLKWASESP